ncbi:hypothetical protein CKY04_22755 [Photorhabdus sp. S8-52]|nr:hypothetical protein CKY03_22725 [Photorhabdus sp. S9-53]RAW92837.1 hypothetical protein CKY05_22725 [Photorhabdus sp. S10-54]RAW96441.1 hypothetical protein CKY04_22745 [Photorhabdus sp. S8-52]RAW96443.1 hypothetical protein CKY04_22755 [Photorhabdus sp. S8-52]
MIKFDFCDVVLVCVFLVFYYAWPVIMIIDGYVIYRTVQCIKRKKYKVLLFLIPVVVLLSGPLIYLLIQFLKVWGPSD